MRLPVNASIALHTVNKYRRRARLALPEPPARSMPSAPGNAPHGIRESVAIPIIGTGIVGQQWRQRQARPGRVWEDRGRIDEMTAFRTNPCDRD